MRPCVWCGSVFFICRCCDRGHAYCGDECRRRGRARCLREARARHQRSPEGRADHRAAMRELRARRRGGVTDQGFGAAARRRKVVPEEAVHAKTEGQGLHRRAAQRCMVCGRASRFVRWWPSRSVRRQR